MYQTWIVYLHKKLFDSNHAVDIAQMPLKTEAKQKKVSLKTKQKTKPLCFLARM